MNNFWSYFVTCGVYLNLRADWQPPVYKKTTEEYEQIERSIAKNFLFSHLGDKDLEIIINAMKQVSFRPGEDIIIQGEGKYQTKFDFGPLD